MYEPIFYSVLKSGYHMLVTVSTLRPMFTTATFTEIDILVTVMASMAIGWLARMAFGRKRFYPREKAANDNEERL